MEESTAIGTIAACYGWEIVHGHCVKSPSGQWIDGLPWRMAVPPWLVSAIYERLSVPDDVRAFDPSI